MAGEIISERRATSNRNVGRDHPGTAGDFGRNQQAEPHLGASEKIATVFFRMSRSMRSRSFSRRSREISAAGSGTEGEATIGCGADPAGPAVLRLRQLRSIEGEMPSSPAIWINGRPLLASRAIASLLNSSVK